MDSYVRQHIQDSLFPTVEPCIRFFLANSTRTGLAQRSGRTEALSQPWINLQSFDGGSHDLLNVSFDPLQSKPK